MSMHSHRVLSLAIAFAAATCALFAQTHHETAEPIRIRAFNSKNQTIGFAWAVPVNAGYVCPRNLLAGASRAVLEKDGGDSEVVNAVLGDDPEHNLIVVATGVSPAHPSTPATSEIEQETELHVVCGGGVTYPVENARLRDLPVFGALLSGRTSHGDAIRGCPLMDASGGWRGIVVWESPLAKPSMVAVPAEWATLLQKSEERSWEQWRRLESAPGKRLRDSLLLEGLEDLWRENYAGTIRSLSELIEARPTDGNAWYYRGYAKAMSGDRLGAIDDYEQAVTHDPDNADAHFSLGFSYLLLKRKLEASEQAKALEEVNPEMATKLRVLIGAMSDDDNPTDESPSTESTVPTSP